MIKIFISYRREDSADVTGRINDRLRQKFGEEAIFTDVDSIPIGVDFREHLDREVGQCDIFLAVIGRRWLSIEDDEGHRRLDDPSDYVRIEVESALNRRIPVVPLLAHGISMPSADELPDSINELAFRNGVPVRRDPDFHSDMDRIISGIEKHLPQREEEDRKRSATEEAKQREIVAETSTQSSEQDPKQVERSVEASTVTPASSSTSIRSYMVTATLILAVIAGGWWYNEKVNRDSELARTQQAADAEAKRRADAEAKRIADAEANRRADTEAKRIADAEAKRRADTETKRIADAEAKRRADAEAKRIADAEAKRRADAEAKRIADAEAKRKADAEGIRKVDAKDKLKASAEAATQKMFTREETIALVSGKTVFWENGNGAYYSPDGKLDTKWEGEEETGKWSVTDEGAVCWHVPSWDYTPCESYFIGPDGLMAVYKGEVSQADKHREGNYLGSL